MYPYLLHITFANQTHTMRYRTYGEAVTEWLELWFQHQDAVSVELIIDDPKPINW